MQCEKVQPHPASWSITHLVQKCKVWSLHIYLTLLPPTSPSPCPIPSPPLPPAPPRSPLLSPIMTPGQRTLGVSLLVYGMKPHCQNVHHCSWHGRCQHKALCSCLIIHSTQQSHCVIFTDSTVSAQQSTVSICCVCHPLLLSTKINSADLLY